jgi:putative flavoprotein involved in K+ transport
VPTEEIEVLVVGAGQAGIAMSEHLGARGIPHLVLERDRIAEKWRTGRWDSLVANGPAWHDRFPGLEFDQLFPDVGPDGFVTKDQVVQYLATYAEKIEAPIRAGVEVHGVVKNTGRPGFTVQTSQGVIHARYVTADAGIEQIHSSSYRNPQQLPAGAVLVVGAGSSGVQIADELQRSGRQVYLSVGPHDRPPRSYRGRDFCWWLGVLGKWEMATPPAGAEHVTIAVSGARGGHTVDFRELAANGMRLVGRTQSYADGIIRFGRDLSHNIESGDANLLQLLAEADAYVQRNGLDLPTEPEAKVLGPLPADAQTPITELDLAAAGITTIVWATGFVSDYRWLPAGALDENGRPKHSRGVSAEPGVYFLGLPWQSRRGSSFIWGVWHDAAYLAESISIQRSYLLPTSRPTLTTSGAL